MSLFDQNLTAAQKSAVVIFSEANKIENLLGSSFVKSYSLTWSNKDATPEEVVSAMGNQAAKMFTLSAMIAQVLIAAGVPVAPGCPNGWSATLNADGTVTVAKKPIPGI